MLKFLIVSIQIFKIKLLSLKYFFFLETNSKQCAVYIYAKIFWKRIYSFLSFQNLLIYCINLVYKLNKRKYTIEIESDSDG